MTGTATDGKKEFYTVKEVADKLLVKPRTVRRWIADGELLACRLGGGHLRIRADDYEAYVEISRGAPRDTASSQT